MKKMAKSVLGVDIGYDSLKLAVVNGKTVRKTAIVPMPKNLIREGRVVSTETMGELIRRTMREHGIRCSQAALVLPNETVFIRGVTMPVMTVDQLNYNLPFEFRDYITDELKDYLFDYAVVSITEQSAEDRAEGESSGEGNESGSVMELMAVAAPKSLLEESKETMHRAGLKLVKAAPSVCAFQALIRAQMNKNGGKVKKPKKSRKAKKDETAQEAQNSEEVQDTESPQPVQEYCILDLGYQSIRMYMFREDRHMVTRVLELGMSSLDQVIADAYSVDVHLAHTYLLSNYENCQSKEYCMNAYGSITVELMRALNFYRFSNPDSHLEDIWICGGGACIRPLQESISETLDLKIHTAAELLPEGMAVEADYALLQAIGITME